LMMVNNLLMMIWNRKLNLNEKMRKMNYLLRMKLMRNKRVSRN
jgi:hypothetical protein